MEPHRFDNSPSRNKELQCTDREFRWRGVAVIWQIEEILNRFVVPPPYLADNPRKPESGISELLHGRQVPQIRPIQGDANHRIPSPDKCPQHSVAEGNALIPTAREVRKLQIPIVNTQRLSGLRLIVRPGIGNLRVGYRTNP
jgi:hypothetical protein